MNGEGEERAAPKDSSEALARVVFALEDIAEELGDVADFVSILDEAMATLPEGEKSTFAGLVRRYGQLVRQAEEGENEPRA